MKRLSLFILLILSKHASNELAFIIIHELMELEDLGKENTIYKAVKEMEKLGLVKQGCKEGRAFTFYITETGKKMIEEKKGKDDEG